MPGRSELVIAAYATQAQASSAFYAIGSCFAIEMKEKLRTHGLKSLESPFGTTYHPIAIANQLIAICTGEWHHRFIERDQHWFDFGAHSALWAKTESELEARLHSELAKTHLELQQSEYLLITWGSAKGYYLNDQLCANCHKQPGTLFETKRSTIQEITEVYSSLFLLLKKHYPKLQIMLSLSPVRHLRDGLLENSLSKSILRCAIGVLEQTSQVSYFPAYELLIDDLRDYRYTKSDLMHPTEEAVDYIWGKFSEALFTGDARREMNEFHGLYKSLQHCPQWPDSEAWKKHLITTQQKVKALSANLDLSLLHEMLSKHQLDAGLV